MIHDVNQNFMLSGPKEMSAYYYDYCNDQRKYQSNFLGFTLPFSSTYSVCNDGSTSFDQPDSTGWNGWNGFCGETATSNLIKMSCGENWHPDGMIHSMAADYTPGTRPSTLVSVINKLAQDSNCGGKKWTYYDTADNAKDYIDSIVTGLRSGTVFTRTRENGTKVKRAPVMTLVKMSGSKTLHWITIVDITGYNPDLPLSSNPKCVAYANQWGKQYKIPCSDLATMSKQTEEVALGAVGKYVRIKQEN